MTTTTERNARPDTAAAVLASARERRRFADAAEADLLQLAVEWAAMHSADKVDAATMSVRGFGETDLPIAGPGAPTVAEFSVAEFALAVGLSHEAGKRYLGEAVELCHRMRRLWARVMGGELPAWKARLVARETVRLSPAAADFVDRHVAPVAHKIRPAQVERLIEEAIARFMPEVVAQVARESWDRRHVTLHDQLVSFTGTMRLDAELDLADALDLEEAVATGAAQRAALGSSEPIDVRRAQALGDLARHQLALDLAGPPDVNGVATRQVVLNVHLSEAALTGNDPVAWVERGRSLVTVEQVRVWCGNDHTRVVVKPVIDLHDSVHVDQYAVPDRIAERIAFRDVTCVFPWCTRPARGCDSDHVIPYGRGPTSTENLAPLCRTHHRHKTHGAWGYTVLDPGNYLWISPHGLRFLRDHTGTADANRPDL